MVAKFCSKSQGQPVTGVRSLAMMSSRALISRDGFMAAGSSRGDVPVCRNMRGDPSQTPLISTLSPGVLSGRHEPCFDSDRFFDPNRPCAVFRRPGFHHLPGLGTVALCEGG